MRTSGSRIIGLLALALVAASCTVTDTEAPALAGPSELALSISLQAVPDTVIQDGVSQSALTIEARGPSSQPVRGATFRIDTRTDGAIGDFGTLSARTVVTSDDGRARVTYTAPPRPLPGTPPTTVTIVVTPVGSDYRGATPREIDLRVIPPGVILPPSRIDAKVAYSPTVVTAFQTITFDASTTTDNGVVCGTNCTYSWNFGDGGSASGMTTTHEFRTSGSYVVTLRVTNSNGQTAQATPVTIQVGAGTPPTASFVFSPVQPVTSEDIFFSAEASRAAEGRRIVAYDWNFGSGRTGTGVTVAKRYDTPGTYSVTLTVTDDAFQQATTTKEVPVRSAAPIAALIFSPTTPTTTTSVVLDARGSTGRNSIVQYTFDYGGPVTGCTGPMTNATGTVSCRYTAAGTYIARVTVVDSAGLTGTATVSVTVTP